MLRRYVLGGFFVNLFAAAFFSVALHGAVDVLFLNEGDLCLRHFRPDGGERRRRIVDLASERQDRRAVRQDENSASDNELLVGIVAYGNDLG